MDDAQMVWVDFRPRDQHAQLVRPGAAPSAPGQLDTGQDAGQDAIPGMVEGPGLAPGQTLPCVAQPMGWEGTFRACKEAQGRARGAPYTAEEVETAWQEWLDANPVLRARIEAAKWRARRLDWRRRRNGAST